MQLLEPKTSIRRELIPGLLGPVAVSMLVVASWLYFDSNRDAHDRRVALVQNLVATFSRDFYAIGAMQDQEMAALVENPKLWDAYMEVKNSPTRMKKFMEDPEISEMLDLAAGKIASYQKSCGGS